MYTSLTGQGGRESTMGQSDPFTHHFRPIYLQVRNVLTTLCVVKWRNAEADLLCTFLCFSSPFLASTEGMNLKAKPKHRASQRSWWGCNIQRPLLNKGYAPNEGAQRGHNTMILYIRNVLTTLLVYYRGKQCLFWNPASPIPPTRLLVRAVITVRANKVALVRDRQRVKKPNLYISLYKRMMGSL